MSTQRRRTVTAGGPTTFCEGGSVTLTANAGTSYLWSNGATTQSISVNQSGAYSVTVTAANGCAATSAATNVTANPLPAATITASGPTTICGGGSVTLTAAPGAEYYWSTGETTQSITVSDAGYYTVRVTSAAGCATISAPTAVVTRPMPTTWPFLPSRALCLSERHRDIQFVGAGGIHLAEVVGHQRQCRRPERRHLGARDRRSDRRNRIVRRGGPTSTAAR